MLEKINQLGIGPGGLGGTVTAMAVNIETYPTHIAGLPVAINICCHVNRHVSRELQEEKGWNYCGKIFECTFETGRY